MNDHDDGVTAAALSDAMQSGTRWLVASPDLPERVAARRRRGSRRAVAASSFGVASVVGLAVVLGGSVGTGRERPVTPAASGTGSASAGASQGRLSHFEVTAVPAGYRFAHGATADVRRADGTPAVNERVSYRRGSAGPLITLQTLTNGTRRLALSDFAAQPGAKVVRVGPRDVIHVQNDRQPGGLNVYQWTEEVGLDVIVDGRTGATDAELRAFIAGLRRRG